MIRIKAVDLNSYSVLQVERGVSAPSSSRTFLFRVSVPRSSILRRNLPDELRVNKRSGDDPGRYIRSCLFFRYRP
jgi:hypothetical protein